MSIFNLGKGNSAISKNMVSGEDYLIFKDGNGVEYNILNLNNDKYMPRTGIIEFSPVRTSKRHINNVNFKEFTDCPVALVKLYHNTRARASPVMEMLSR